MGEHEESKVESVMEKLSEKIHGGDLTSSSSDSDDEISSSSLQSRISRLFGREKPVHHVLGGGKSADLLLWRNKRISAGVLGAATAVWVLFEVVEYHLVSLICRVLMIALTILFFWSPSHIPEVVIPKEPVAQLASALRIEINRAAAVITDIASGRDLKKFLSVVAGLWVLSILGSCSNFLTLFYITVVLLHTVPALYEKYEDQVDTFAEKAMTEIKKLYAAFDVKVLSKIPRWPSRTNKKVA